MNSDRNKISIKRQTKSIAHRVYIYHFAHNQLIKMVLFMRYVESNYLYILMVVGQGHFYLVQLANGQGEYK